MNSEIRFGDLAILRKESVKPGSEPELPYLGLEHIQPGALQIRAMGVSSEVTSQKLRFHKGDILFGKLRPYFRKIVTAPVDGICSTDIWVVRGVDPADNEFIKYWMASEEFIRSSTHAAEGSGMPRAQWNWVSEFRIPGLSREARQAIGRILGLIDEKIVANLELSQTLEQVAQTVFKSWFVDFDPVHANAHGQQPEGMDGETAAMFPASFQDSQVGRIPSGWTVNTLTEVAEFLNGLALQKYPAVDGEASLPVIKIPQLKSGTVEGAGKASGDVPAKYVVADGDIVFSWSGALEVVLWAGGNGALNQHLFKVTPKHVPKWFALFSTLQHLPEFRKIAASKATTMGHIQRGHLEEALCAVPNPELLRHASNVIQPLLEASVAYRAENRRLAKLRDALLPRLISGELKLPEELLSQNVS